MPIPTQEPVSELPARVQQLVLAYHKNVEGEYGCPGLSCPGVQRLLLFATSIAFATVAADEEVEVLLLQRAQAIAELQTSVDRRAKDYNELAEKYDASAQESQELLQAVLDAIEGTIDTSTNIADHPNVLFAQMQRLRLVKRAEAAEAQLTARAQAIEQVQAEKETVERWLRQEWWLNHGHDGLYGDDGEMQCGKCHPVWDYRREPIAALKERVESVRLEQLVAKLKADAARVARAPQPEGCDRVCSECGHIFTVAALEAETRQGWGHPCHNGNPRVGVCESFRPPIQPASAPQPEQRPKIVCLCGSTRFIEQFAVLTWLLEIRGNIVLGCTLLPGWYCGVRSHFAETLGIKEQRDAHHKQKIDLADEVLVINIDLYIGESTRSEIEYATAHGKPVRYLTDEPELLQQVLPPSAAPRPASAALLALIAQWRDEASLQAIRLKADVLRRCADDLSAALARAEQA